MVRWDRSYARALRTDARPVLLGGSASAATPRLLGRRRQAGGRLVGHAVVEAGVRALAPDALVAESETVVVRANGVQMHRQPGGGAWLHATGFPGDRMGALA